VTPLEGSRIRVVVVDDEALARQVLREYLSGHPDLTIVAECANGFEAVKAIDELKPDLLLLDIQMPKLDGFEVLELLDRPVETIFVTAHDEHALRAFEVHAVDYLLKPVDPERLADALGRARTRLRAAAAAVPPAGAPAAESRNSATRSRGAAAPSRQASIRPKDAGETPLPPDAAARARTLASRARALAATARAPGRPLERVLVRDGAKVHVLPVETIDFIEAQDDYVRIRAAGKDHLKQQTLAEIETLLDPARFVRIHRSYILNVDRLARIETYAKDSRVAILRDGTRIALSRAGYQRLREFL